MTRLTKVLFVSALISIGFAGRAEASSITCPTTGTPDRTVTVSNAIGCATIGGGGGTANATDIHNAFGGTWIAAGTFSGSGEGTNNWLTFDITTGSFGSLPASGTWAIDPLLWQLHPRAAL